MNGTPSPTYAPASRVTVLRDVPARPDGEFVLYWMIANRRTRWNFGLQHAVAHAHTLNRPLLVLEALRVDYPWASDRLHAFVIQGMASNRDACEAAGVRYLPYLERESGAGKGLLEALAARACLVVTDEFPCFFLPRMVSAAAERIEARLEQVDGNGVIPLRATPKAFTTAHAFRRWLQKHLPDHLGERPLASPLATLSHGAERDLAAEAPAKIPAEILERWPAATDAELEDPTATVADLPIDHSVGVVATPGGASAAARQLAQFVATKLEKYADDRNRPEQDAASGFSPALHFGHLSAHEVVHAVLEREGWAPEHLATTTDGSREGWWGASPTAEAFLDQVITWRELGYVFAFHRSDYDQFESLPDWAHTTMDAHRGDERSHIYSLAEFESAATHDELWNAAQRELVRDGRIHNYLRMLWGKKIVEWTPDYETALEIMIELNNKYALDGRNPNSYSGIFWVLGRFDRAWGPVRPVFGKLRYMSSENTARKVKVKNYLAHFAR